MNACVQPHVRVCMFVRIAGQSFDNRMCVCVRVCLLVHECIRTAALECVCSERLKLPACVCVYKMRMYYRHSPAFLLNLQCHLR